MAFENWSEHLIKKLSVSYNVEVDFSELGVKEDTVGLRTLFIQNSKGKGKTLYLNSKLDQKQLVHALVKELGAQQIMSEDSLRKRNPMRKDFPDLLLENQTLYFAGAALIPEEDIVNDLKTFFEKGNLDQGYLDSLMEKYPAPPEVFMGRLTQILPHHFNFNQMFFLCCNENVSEGPDSYFISQELHLGKLHHPHGVSLQEHYCRRWITTELLAQLKSENLDQCTGAQVSKMEEGGRPYLCLSLARKRASDPGLNSCFTLGLAIDDNFKEVAKFSHNFQVEEKVVGRTCERCSQEDCRERVSPPSIYLRELRQKRKEKAINSLLK